MQCGVAWRDIAYAQVDGTELTGRCYRPVVRESAALPAWPHLLHVSCGGWTQPEHLHAELHKELARRGGHSTWHEVRSLPEHRHPAASMDAERAMRWCLSQADARSLDLSRVVLLGTGSGAHALLSAFHRSPAVRRLLQPRAIVAAFPMADPLTALRRGAPTPECIGINVSALEYFGDRVRMRRAGLAEMVHDVLVPDLPPLVVTRSESVPGAPPEVTDELAFAWRRAGGDAEVVDIEPGEDAALLSKLCDVMELWPEPQSIVSPEEAPA